MAARFNQPQRLIAIQGLAATALLFALWWLRDVILQEITLPTDTFDGRLQFVAKWLLLPGFALLCGVLSMATGRFFNGATDGSRTPSAHRLEINLRYNLNTLEQAVLATIAWTALALALPHAQLNLIALLAIVFIVGRFAFWIGYSIRPVARAFGMVLTLMPTCVCYLWLLVEWVKS
jgi:uncharacterized membrane protein YecN with MAPEG domain